MCWNAGKIYKAITSKKEGVVNKNWEHKVQTLQSVHILNENGWSKKKQMQLQLSVFSSLILLKGLHVIIHTYSL